MSLTLRSLRKHLTPGCYKGATLRGALKVSHLLRSIERPCGSSHWLTIILTSLPAYHVRSGATIAVYMTQRNKDYSSEPYTPDLIYFVIIINNVSLGQCFPVVIIMYIIKRTLEFSGSNLAEGNKQSSLIVKFN